MKSRKKRKNKISEFIQVIFIFLFVFVIIYLFLGQLCEVSGNSMLPNFNNKEQLIAESLSVKLKDLKRGDVIVFESPLENNKLLIKRVIGLPEENFKIVDGKVYINGNLLNEESYLQSNEYTFVEKYFENNIEYQIPNDSYVVLGDNRDESTDSREWGYVDIDSIIGKVIVKIYPLKSIGIVKRARY